jgi:RDD family
LSRRPTGLSHALRQTVRVASIPRLRLSTGRRKLRPAPLKARFAAALINKVSALGALALILAAGVFAYSRLRKRHVKRAGPLRAIVDDLDAEPAQAERWPNAQRIAETAQKWQVKLALELISIGLPLRRTERRSLGFRLLGLRLVDARSGGEPTRRQRLVREILRRLWGAVHRRLLPVKTPAVPAEKEQLQAEIAAAHRAHADDQQALQQALMRVYRENRISPIRASWLPPLLWLLARVPLIAAISVPMPWSPLRQSLLDWLTGTVVVVDR